MTAHLHSQSPVGRHPVRTPPPSSATSCCSRGLPGRIESWLLHSGIQIDDGVQRGGIAGWLDSEGRAEFVYPEIAGYYLTSMAWLASGAASSPEHAAIARFRARRAADWLKELLATSTYPPTRLYLSEPQADWRNDAAFSFDIAMAARGIASAHDNTNRLTLTTLSRLLTRISAGARIMRSHEVVEGGNTAMPERWSTLPGPHHLKAAAAILRLGESVAGTALTATAHRTCKHWATALGGREWPCQELHALLYGLEGMLIADAGTGDYLDQAARVFTRLMMELQSSDGTLPETVTGGLVRSDVLAQALRVGMVLRGGGYLGGKAWADRIDGLFHALSGLVRTDGGVLFATNQHIANTWCAMFAHQALYLYGRRDARTPVPQSAISALV